MNIFVLMAILLLFFDGGIGAGQSLSESGNSQNRTAVSNQQLNRKGGSMYRVRSVTWGEGEGKTGEVERILVEMQADGYVLNRIFRVTRRVNKKEQTSAFSASTVTIAEDEVVMVFEKR